MEQICDYEECTGCSACMNICPKSAISMHEEEPLGFLHPVINQSLCIDCKICKKVCPVNNSVVKKYPICAYAAISKSELDLETSASGGAAAIFTNVILKDNGVVFGCVQRNYTSINHEKIDTKENAFLLKGSKYVQSNINLTYREVRFELNAGKKVLFIGTPCQVGGLKSFLNKDYEDLVCVDLCCHGVSSQKLLREDVLRTLNYAEGVGCEDNLSVSFRKKIKDVSVHKSLFGFDVVWGASLSYGFFLKEDNKNDIRIRKDKDKFLVNNYITAFISGVSHRESCFQCSYACPERCGDITIADFWGIKNTKISTEKGISLILVNSEKGHQFVKKSLPLMIWEQHSVEEAINGNGQLQHPFCRPYERNLFEQFYPINKEKAYHLSLKKFKREYKKKYMKKYIRKKIQDILNKFL